MQKRLLLSQEDRVGKNTYTIYIEKLRRQGLGEQAVHCTRTSSKGSLLFMAAVLQICVFILTVF